MYWASILLKISWVSRARYGRCGPADMGVWYDRHTTPDRFLRDFLVSWLAYIKDLDCPKSLFHVPCLKQIVHFLYRCAVFFKQKGIISHALSFYERMRVSVTECLPYNKFSFYRIFKQDRRKELCSCFKLSDVHWLNISLGWCKELSFLL